GRFGAFSGQGFVAGEGSKHLLRLMLEEVDGVWQGAVTDFAAIESPEPGLDFLNFTPTGDELLAGQGGQLLSIQPAGGSIFAIRSVSLASDGFEVDFTRPVDRSVAIDPSTWKIQIWQPGTPEASAIPFVPDSEARSVIDSDGLTVTLQTSGITEGKVYVFDLSGIPSESGEKLTHGLVYYTLNQLRPKVLPPALEPTSLTESPEPAEPPVAESDTISEASMSKAPPTTEDAKATPEPTLFKSDPKPPEPIEPLILKDHSSPPQSAEKKESPKED
ncbi:MAG: hypothetical protein KDN20_22935, partial [Verrucomicrobiae bacterium]|nr:hypothetical protein [Verrucomicrobiae bacterium]